MPQFARPESDALVGNYVNELAATEDLFESIDEATPDDNDYIESPESPSDEVYVTKLSEIVDPAVGTGHVLRVRAGTSVPTGGEQIDMVAELREGYVNEGSQGTLIATLTQPNISQGSFTTYTKNLTEGEANSITDYSDLYVRVVLTVAS